VTFGFVDRRVRREFGSSKPKCELDVASKSPEIRNRNQVESERPRGEEVRGADGSRRRCGRRACSSAGEQARVQHRRGPLRIVPCVPVDFADRDARLRAAQRQLRRERTEASGPPSHASSLWASPGRASLTGHRSDCARRRVGPPGLLSQPRHAAAWCAVAVMLCPMTSWGSRATRPRSRLFRGAAAGRSSRTRRAGTRTPSRSARRCRRGS
jgi:hypothetical protein